MNARSVLLVAACVVAIAVSPWLGPPLDGPSAGFVWWSLRAPRVALGVLVGGGLALTGAAFQLVLENPLATPSTVGTTAGASLGALAVLVLWPGAAVGAPLVALGAFAGAVAVSLAIAALASLARLRPEERLLAGVAVGLAAGAVTTGLQLQADAAATIASVRWSLGSLSTVGFAAPLRLLPLSLVGGAVLLGHLRALQAIAGGVDRAATQGVAVTRVRVAVLIAGSLVVAGCVATTGPIAFVGLVVPHLVRGLVPGGPRTLLPLSLVAGAAFLPLADGLARVVLPHRDLPVGVITAALGAPALVFLMLRRRR
jgi:iron complex transport system permease protein